MIDDIKIRGEGTSLSLFTGNGKKILFFGSQHSWNPKDPEMDQIKEIFKKFNPDLVLVEATKLTMPRSEREAILTHGEVGLIEYLARKRDIKVIPADPNEKQIVKKLLKKYSKEELVLYFILRTLDQYPKIGSKPKFETFLKSTIDYYRFLDPNLSYESFKRIFQKILKKNFNPNFLGKFTELFNPKKNLAITNAIARDESFLRDSYTINVLKKMFRRYDKILIVKGSGHTKFFKKNIPKILK